MLSKKTVWFWKSAFTAISFMLLLCIPGCSIPAKETQVDQNASEVQTIPENPREDSEKILDICLDLYQKASKENKLADLKVIRNIVNCLGEYGYPAIDSRNQIDMTEEKQVIQFCKSVDAKEKKKLTILEVTYLGGLIKYDLQTNDGKVTVARSYYQYENDNMQKTSRSSYTADFWQYTEEGYLMFSGAWHSEEQYVLTLSETEEHKAFRVKPLDEKCRELNRQYLLPISYEQNNIFLTDWSENDFGTLNFYDLYDIFYPQINAKSVPYNADENLGVGAVYQIPKDEFESVIMTYFNIDSDTLQSKTTYDSEDATYEYKPRGFYEVEYPEYPYSEVVEFTENSDGTITLTVHVVFPYAGISKVYVHEVVVRPLETGGVQYVSNRIIPSENNYEETWHTPRLKEEEWEELYRKNN